MQAKWRVRDGKKIRVYGERWLLGDSDNKAMSPISFLPSDVVVADLMDLQTGWWNSQVIARKVKAIPISTIAQEDILIWLKSKDGTHTIKSGYNILCEEHARDSPSSSTPGAARGIQSYGGLVQILFQQNTTCGNQEQSLWRFVKSVNLSPKMLCIPCGIVMLAELSKTEILVRLTEEKLLEVVLSICGTWCAPDLK